jgi:hypothetical protein
MHDWTQWVSLATALLIGVVGTIVTQRFTSNNVGPSRIASQPQFVPAQTYVARLVSFEGNVWSDSKVLKRNDRIRQGQSVSMLEGLGQVALDGGADVQMEGPTALQIDSDGGIALDYGRVLATAPVDRPCYLRTPLGELMAAPGTTVGIALFGSEIQVYARQGTLAFHTSFRKGKTIVIEESQSRRFGISSSGEFMEFKPDAIRNGFASFESIESDRLRIPNEYVAAVRERSPLAYYRFNSRQGNRWSNDVDDRTSLVSEGEVKQVNLEQQASFIEFGIRDLGSLVADGPLNDRPLADYSVEFWVKPSHVHTGAIVSLVSSRTDPKSDELHSLLLGVQGRNEAFGREFAFRYLHRSRPSANPDDGVNCFSTNGYHVRRWQHVVARRSGDELQLFVDARLVSEGNDPNPIPAGQTLVVGQLYSFETMRPFIGQLDELAIYESALTDKEISRHYRIVRPN